MIITKIQKETLQEMEGKEILYMFNEEECVSIEYPYIWVCGIKHKLTATQWNDLLNQYWNDSSNDGYWLMEEAKKEFGL